MTTFTRYRVTWATYGLVGYFAYLETVLGPLMPFLRAEQNLSYTVASLHFSAFASGGVLIGVIGERFESRWGRSATLWGGGAHMAAGALLLTAASAAPGTISGAFVMGFFGAVEGTLGRSSKEKRDAPLAGRGFGGAGIPWELRRYLVGDAAGRPGSHPRTTKPLRDPRPRFGAPT
jgi:MFS family permease